MARPSIAIVVTHFGPLPSWMPAFLLSCASNPDVRWLIYTDQDAVFPRPANVELRAMTREAFNERASDALGFPIAIRAEYPRKLGDLKPTYGLVFADDLAAFDFWAHSELDIVWGDIRRFLTDDLLHAHDIVSARHYKLAGHCTLFRNTPDVNRAFELVPDARDLLVHTKYRRLDESAFTTQLRGRLEQVPPPAFPRIFWEHDLTMSAAYQNALVEGPLAQLWWRDGRTFTVEGRELMYLHFHRLKPLMRGINFGFDDRPAAFAIDKTGVWV